MFKNILVILLYHKGSTLRAIRVKKFMSSCNFEECIMSPVYFCHMFIRKLSISCLLKPVISTKIVFIETCHIH